MPNTTKENIGKVAHGKILDRAFYNRSTILVALDMLGKVLLHETPRGILSGRIVELEAYLGKDDPACHVYRGRTKRTGVFWEGPGKIYVFINYGMHHCLNIITEEPRAAGCVLIRALEPIGGIQIMKENRNTCSLHSLTNGPGKLTKAFGITLMYNRSDITRGNLVIVDNKDYRKILVTSRVGVSQAKSEPLRFCLDGSRFASPYKNRVLTFFSGDLKAVKNAFQNQTIKIRLKRKILSDA